MKALFQFPDPVNETSARVVAAGVVVQGLAFLVVREWWVLVPLVYGFLARVVTGPTLSPLGQLATRVVTPRLRVQHRLVPGPPKQFAQGMGLVFSASVLVSWLLDAHVLAFVLTGGLLVAATLESGFAVCLGCLVFSRLMRWGVVPRSVCESCDDLSSRLASR